MSIESYIEGDPRMSINTNIKEKCLDPIREAFKGEGGSVDAADIILLAISIYKNSGSEGMPNVDCIESFANTGGKTQVLNYIRMSDDHLAYLFAESIVDMGIDKGLDFRLASQKWEEWAEEGLKILYCNYFAKYYSQSDHAEFFKRIYDLTKNIDTPTENYQRSK